MARIGEARGISIWRSGGEAASGRASTGRYRVRVDEGAASMIRRLRVTGFKSLQDIEVRLEPLTVLIGPNAAGKSNILDALHLLARTASCDSLKEAFEAPYRGTALESLSLPAGGIPELLKRDSVVFSLEVDVELTDAVVSRVKREMNELTRVGRGRAGARSGSGVAEREAAAYAGVGDAVERDRKLRYTVAIRVKPSTGLTVVEREEVRVLTQSWGPSRRRRPVLETGEDKLLLRSGDRGRPAEFDRYLTHTVLSRSHYLPHHPHVVALREELKSWLFFYFEPRERMRAANPVKEVHHLGLMGEDLAAFLNTLKVLSPEQFETIERGLRLLIPSVEGVNVEVDTVGEVRLSLQEGQVPVPAGVVSEGTLRILGLLALSGIARPLSVLGFEEPENGIHPRRLRNVARFLEDRASAEKTQVIVTTHSPLLADYLPHDSLLVVRKDGARTTVTPLTTWRRLFAGSAVDDALDDEVPDPSLLILRGDLDA